MSSSEEKDVKNSWLNQTKDIDERWIFLNNVKIALVMFVPLLGIVTGIFSGLLTGMIISATYVDLNSDLNGLLALLTFTTTSFGLMETIAYGLAISRSGVLLYSLLRRKPWRGYVISTLMEIGIVIVLLLAGAVIEYEMIQSLTVR